MNNIPPTYTNEKVYTTFFDYAFIFFGIFYAFKESQLGYLDLKFVTYPTLLLSVAFSFLSILHNYKWNRFHTLLFFLLFFIPLYLKIAYTSNVMISTMLILAAYNIPFSHIVKMCIKVLILVFAIVLSSVALGIIEDRLYDRDVDLFEEGTAHDIGFKYYSYYSYLVMGFVQCCLYLWRNQLTFKKIFFLILFSYIVFILSSTRLQLYACVAFIIAIFILPYIPKKILHNKLLAAVAVISYPLICILLYYVSKYFILSIYYEGYEELNRAMSDRLRLNEEAFLRYDVTLWGNDLDLDTNPTRKRDYFYIDSGYLHVLLGDGLVFITIILLLYSVLTYKIYKTRAYYLYLWMIIYAVLNISNGFLVSLLANPILLLALSDTKIIQDDYYGGKDEQGYGGNDNVCHESSDVEMIDDNIQVHKME